MRFAKKDLFFCLITGLTTGIIAWRVLTFLRPGLFDRVGFLFGFLLGVPLLWIVGVNLGYLLGRWLGFFNQFGKYTAVGFTNTAVDFGVLNLLISWTGIAAGWHYSLFKIISFATAVSHSYFWNRFWVFQSTNTEHQRNEFAKFIGVNITAAVINVASATIVVNLIHPLLGFDVKTWANLGAVIGSAIALLATFIGLKFAVFKK